MEYKFCFKEGDKVNYYPYGNYVFTLFSCAKHEDFNNEDVDDCIFIHGDEIDKASGKDGNDHEWFYPDGLSLRRHTHPSIKIADTINI